MLDRNVIMQWGSVLSATGSLVERGCLRGPTDMWVKCEVLVTAGTMYGAGCNSLAKQALDKCLRLSGVPHPACWCQNQQKTRRWWLQFPWAWSWVKTYSAGTRWGPCTVRDPQTPEGAMWPMRGIQDCAGARWVAHHAIGKVALCHHDGDPKLGRAISPVSPCRAPWSSHAIHCPGKVAQEGTSSLELCWV